MLVLEHRVARGKGSINQNGNYQGGIAGLEVHVKDEARFRVNGPSSASTKVRLPK